MMQEILLLVTVTLPAMTALCAPQLCFAHLSTRHDWADVCVRWVRQRRRTWWRGATTGT